MVECNIARFWTSQLLNYLELSWLAYALILYIMYKGSGEPAYRLTGWFITFMSLPLYPMQAYFNMVRVDAVCPQITMWVFPHFGSSSAGSILFLAVLFWWYCDRFRPTFWDWVFMGLILVLPATVHVWHSDVKFWMVAASAGWGMLWAALYFALIWNSSISFAYLFNVPVWTTKSKPGDPYVSVLIRTPEARAAYEWANKCREQRDLDGQRSILSWASFSWLSSKYGVTKSQKIPLESHCGTSVSTLSQTTSLVREPMRVCSLSMQSL